MTACGSGSTTLTGTVFAPNKTDPLYNAILYVPNDKLDPFPAGVNCDKCGALASGKPITSALSGPDGKFRLENVPTGDNIPLVIQIGRWRRQVTIPRVDACKDTALDAEQTRLPRNKSEGDIPLIAIDTSFYDPTECILLKIGIDQSEFTAPTGDGRVHLYRGEGASLQGAKIPPASALWQHVENLNRYDLVAFPCQVDDSTKPDSAGRANVKSYADSGGRVFVTDLAQEVINQAPSPWPQTADWGPSGGFNNPASIDTTFPKGAALADWLQATGATTTRGQLELQDTYDRFSKANPPAQRWVYSSTDTQTYSFNTPVEASADNQCGRVVYSSFHIAAEDTSGGGGLGFPGSTVFPTVCSSGPLTAQEKILEFLLFDLASCIQKDDTAPVAPPPVH
ncbi:Tryptophan synthase alpha chain [Labilithrix luteola]|uniref:Tryptophan synthase alpha chain n=1 Tax=Labilithrix luteola TaxID=1391654 RepID=A0A0K1PPN6_9BACT|nr:Tryptophan synthase alpha chain [Labilithrix luteola]